MPFSRFTAIYPPATWSSDSVSVRLAGATVKVDQPRRAILEGRPVQDSRSGLIRQVGKFLSYYGSVYRLGEMLIPPHSHL